MNRKNIIISVIIALLAAIAIFAITHDLANNNGQVQGGVHSVLSQSQCPSGVATTSPSYMTAGTATTSCIWANDSANYTSLLLQFTASTSGAILGWTYEFSNGNNCDIAGNSSGSGCDWFEEDGVILPATGVLAFMEHASTTITHRWQPGSSTASTSLKAVPIPKVAAKYARARFFIPIGSTSGGVLATPTRIIEGQ